jgi:hypothetical protein
MVGEMMLFVVGVNQTWLSIILVQMHYTQDQKSPTPNLHSKQELI